MKPADLAGKIYGDLEVISIRPERDSSGGALWNCVCQCGKTTIVSAGHLKSGNTRSCGCLHREAAATMGRRNWKSGGFANEKGW